MLRLGEPAEVRLGLDPVADVPGDRHDPAGFAGRDDVLEEDLDRHRLADAVAIRERRRLGVEGSGDEGRDEAPDADRVEILDDLVASAPTRSASL